MKVLVEEWELLDDGINALTLESCSQDAKELHELKRLLQFDLGLKLPLVLTKRERPDFEIAVASGRRKIGCEHTWAADERWEESVQHMRNTVDPKFKIVSRNWLEGETASGRNLGQRIADQEGSSPVWEGEREHANAKVEEVMRAIENKSEALSKDGFHKYSENWLLISDRNPFTFMNWQCFKDSLTGDNFPTNSMYTCILFMTQVYDYKCAKLVDRLVYLSRDCISYIPIRCQ